MDAAEIKPVICPYCCHRFEPAEARFRLGGVLSHDKADARAENAGKVLDNRLFNYHRVILQSSEEDAVREATQFPAVSVGELGVSVIPEEIERFGFPQSVIYTLPGGLTLRSETRLCPNCHNELPVGYGMRDTLLISVVGDARSGKSVFLTMLINELNNNDDMQSKLTFIGSSQVQEKLIRQYQQPLLVDHTLISSTKRRKVPPFAFNYWYRCKTENGVFKEKSIDVVFYDIAGEDLRDSASIRQNGFNIRNSSGLLFLADPTNFKRLTDLFRFSDHALIDAIPKDNSNQLIFDTFYNYFIGLENAKCPIPLALIISKSDLLNFTDIGFFTNKPDNRFMKLMHDERHDGALNMRCIKGLNSEARELLSFLGEDALLNNAWGCFKSVSCFVMSSLGKKPSVEQITDPATNETVEQGYLDGPPEPFRVKDAFYWLLMKNGHLYKYENGRYVLGHLSDEEPIAPAKERGLRAFVKRMLRFGKK
jgi:GTPase SAR1 family protein